MEKMKLVLLLMWDLIRTFWLSACGFVLMFTVLFLGHIDTHSTLAAIGYSLAWMFWLFVFVLAVGPWNVSLGVLWHSLINKK